MGRPLFDRALTTEFTDVCTADNIYIAVPFTGRVILFQSVLAGAITAADAVITTAIAPPGSNTFTAITGGGWTVANAGSAAGDYDEARPTANNLVREGSRIRVTTDGGGTGPQKLGVTVTIRESGA